MEKEIKQEFKINVSYINLVKELIDKKIEIASGNKDEIKKLYQKKCKLKFNNIPRVIKRINRDELKKMRSEKLKELKLSQKDFDETGEKLKELSKKRIASNYVTV